jgi:hypothetical protein
LQGNIDNLLNHNTMSTNTASEIVVYNLPDLKRPADDAIALELFQIVEEVKAHLPVAKQETVSEPFIL